MSTNCNCYFKTSCAGISIVASIIIGLITAMLRFMGVISTTPAFLWVTFGIAVVYLGILLIISAFSSCADRNYCKRITIPVLLVGILGTILTSVILLGIEFAATSIIGAIITGIVLAFFTLIVTSTACLIKCQYQCLDD